MNDKITARAAIRTRYHGPTNFNQSRISAYREGFGDIKTQRVFVNFEYGASIEENHARAAQAFADKFLRDGAKIDPRGLCFDNDYFWTWGWK